MNRSLFAFFIAVILHLLLIFLIYFILSNTPKYERASKEEKILISLKELPKKPKKAPTTHANDKTVKQAPPLPKGSQFEKIIQEPIKYKENIQKRVTKLNQKKLQPKKPAKKIMKRLPKKELFVPVTEKKPQDQDMDWLFEDKSMFEEDDQQESTQKGAHAGKNIQELYGDDFGKLSVGQQKYILDNMEIMRRITQEVLNRQARVANINNLHVNSNNVIEFYLHPNGDMSDFKFLKKSGYYVLDDITRSTIQFAYSKYPYPKEKTLIRYNVFYHLR